MTIQKTGVSHSNAYAHTAELVVSDVAFRKADSAPYEDEAAHYTHQEVLAHQAARNRAEEVVFDAFASNPHTSKEEQFWNMQREASIARIGGTAFGSFQRYFDQLPSYANPTDLDADMLPMGEAKVIETNTSIVRFKKSISDPMEFMEAALGRIKKRKTLEKDAVAPENYATALKFFADKYSELDITNGISIDEINELVSACLEGFFDIARKDEPNFIEMTNIHSAIRILPKGAVSVEHVEPLLLHTLKQLPDSSNKSITTLLGMIPKLDLDEDGEIAASVVNLALRKSNKFETTYDFRTALRSITVLPKTEASDQAIRTLLDYRNNLEQSLDLEGADEVMERIRTIADNVVGSDDLYKELKQLGETVGRTASEWAKRSYREGNYTPSQWDEVQVVFKRMMTNYASI